MRPFLVLLHRWLGLSIGLFLILSALTGTIIAWQHELDAWLNPELSQTHSSGPFIPSLQLAQQIEQQDPRRRVTYIPFQAEPGKALVFGVTPAIDPTTQQHYELGYNEVFIDPVTGKELGHRQWGAVWPVNKENLIPFLYVLHYSLHLPGVWGVWLMGGVAVLWFIDCFTGLYLTFPARRVSATSASLSTRPDVKLWLQRWTACWKLRIRNGTVKLTFDLHRAFALWTWVLLLMLSFTGFSLNLYSEVFYPVLSSIAEVTPSVYESAAPGNKQPTSRASFASILTQAEQEANRRDWQVPVYSIYYLEAYDFFRVKYHHPEQQPVAGLGPRQLFFAGESGDLLGEVIPGQGTLADVFIQSQFPLHSGRIIGLPGRILVSILGLVVTLLTLTGFLIWWRKRRSRLTRNAVRSMV